MSLRMIVLLIALGQCSGMMGQSHAPSLYSVYGIGVPVSTGFGLLEAMSGSSAALRPEYGINTGNPAGLTSVAGPFTMIFSTGFNIESTHIDVSGNDVTTLWDGNMTNLDLWFRFRPYWAAQISVAPFSQVKYDLFSTRVYEPDGSSYDIHTKGSGGINQVRLSQGWTIFEGFHLGITGLLYFGNISSTQLVEGLATADDFSVTGRSALRMSISKRACNMTSA